MGNPSSSSNISMSVCAKSVLLVQCFKYTRIVCALGGLISKPFCKKSTSSSIGFRYYYQATNNLSHAVNVKKAVQCVVGEKTFSIEWEETKGLFGSYYFEILSFPAS